MYPPLWGYLFWSLLHAAAKAFAVYFPDEIPPELAEALFRCLTRLCKYLPCPGCRFHCLNHAQASPPRFNNGVQFWKWTVDFHNAVNARTNKLTISYEEAETLLIKQLAEFEWTVDKIEKAFLQDWWTAIFMTSFSFSLTPDTPKEEEKNEYRVCYLVPFGFKQMSDSKKKCRDVMHEFCSDPALLVLDNRDKIFESLTNLHNSISSDFGRVPKTILDMKALFSQRFEAQNTSSLTRANQVHEEDQKKMIAMQKELNELRSGGLSSKNGGDASDTDNDYNDYNDYKIATIVLASFVGALIIIGLSLFMVFRFGHWKLVKLESSKKLVRKGMVHREEVEEIDGLP